MPVEIWYLFDLIYRFTDGTGWQNTGGIICIGSYKAEALLIVLEPLRIKGEQNVSLYKLNIKIN